MSERRDKKYFSWGCSIPVDPGTGFPTSRSITHVRNCACPGEDDDDGVRMAILEAAHHMHQTNVVEYRIPVVNVMAQVAAAKIGISLSQSLEDLPIYEGKVYWEDGVCIEILGRGFTPKEFEHLHRLTGTRMLCEWII
jgi:hypothetical protein